VSDEKLWDESPTSRHLQVLYLQTSFKQEYMFYLLYLCKESFEGFLPLTSTFLEKSLMFSCRMEIFKKVYMFYLLYLYSTMDHLKVYFH